MVVVVSCIAYFGPSGTFTEIALAQMESAGAFDAAVTRLPKPSQAAALEAVRCGEADGAVVPIESSIDGPVTPTLDALAIGSPLQVRAEICLKVAFTVASMPGTELADVRTVAAYPVALRQVQQWLAEHLPHASVHASASNAAAAYDVAHGYAEAGVTTALASKRFGLVALAESVADYHDATTRFVAVAAPGVPAAATGSDRTSVVFEVPNRPGELLRAFGEFSNRGIDLTMIASRPTRTGMGTYRFHLECVGHIGDDAIGEALQSLYRNADWVRFLGSWPADSTGGRPGLNPPSYDESAQWLAGLRKGPS